MTYEETLKYLDSLVNYEKTGFDLTCKSFDLEKIKKILTSLGNPQRSFRSIHVAGTKGKGSVCTFISYILKEAGYKVGLFTSPHISTPRERIKIDNNMIEEEEVANTFTFLKEHIQEDSFTFFEIYFLLSVIYFKKKEVDFAVFEVGMGGRLDATNVIDSEISVITPISYDHMNVLGEKIEQIARQKAGIVKKSNKLCFCSPQKPRVMEVIKEKCENEGVTLKIVGEDTSFSNVRYIDKETVFDVRGIEDNYDDCKISMIGKFQVTNSTLAIAVCENLINKDDRLNTIQQGIYKAFIPGRLEIISKNPSIVIDGAQNAESVRKLKYSIEQYFKYDRLILLLGASKDKDIKGISKELGSFADEVVITRALSQRAADPLVIRGFFRGEKAQVAESVKEALGVVLSKARPNDLILATGSFFIIADLRRLITRDDRV